MYNQVINKQLIKTFMHKLKIQYLSDDNFELKRQITTLKKIIQQQSISDCNRKSLIYQLNQQNQRLNSTINLLKCQLLLEKQVRIIQKIVSEENLSELNRTIFQLKQQIQSLEKLTKHQHKQSSNFIQKWFQSKFKQSKQPLHEYINPILVFQILDELLKQSQQKDERLNRTSYTIYESNKLSSIIKQNQHQQKIEDEDEEYVKQNNNIHEQQSTNNLCESNSRLKKWYQGQSSLYFIKKKQSETLFLKLQNAKTMQYILNNCQIYTKSDLHKLQNTALLRKSYLSLIAQYQLLKKQIRMYEQYIQQLQERNHLMVDSLTDRTIY